MRVAIIGQGYVGLPLALNFADHGVKVLGLDASFSRVQSLLTGSSPFDHIPDERLRRHLDNGNYHVTTSWEEYQQFACYAVLICVPTPLGAHREPDLSAVEKVAEEIGKRLEPNQLVVLESTTYPGTTDKLLRQILNQHSRGMISYFLAYSPEREDPGVNSEAVQKGFADTLNVPKIVGGVNIESTLRAAQLYSLVFNEVVRVSHSRVAESAKLLENIYRAVNIGLINEMKVLLDHMGVDVWEVISAAKTKPYGFHAFYPGPGIGGHCIPLDPFYFSWKAAENGDWSRFIELAGEINASMPGRVVAEITRVLSKKKKVLSESRVLLLGAAYKRDIDDDRESPTYKVLATLKKAGGVVDVCDPFIPRHDFVVAARQIFRTYDVLVLMTDHSCLLDPSLYDRGTVMVDTRGHVWDHSIEVYRA